MLTDHMRDVGMAWASDKTQTMEVSLCICTRNRPDELGRALDSVLRSGRPVSQIIVSDDSNDGRTRELSQRHPLDITYVVGPRKGLGANRNNAVRTASGSHVLLLDDDAELGREFLQLVEARLLALPSEQRQKTIVTGVVVQDGQAVHPNEQGFLGFQSRPYKSGEPLCTMVISAALIPHSVFRDVHFDPRLRYGYDEVDFSTQAVALGYEIVPCFEAANAHFPSPIGRDEYRLFRDASRLYVTLKRRRWTEGSWLRAWPGFGLAIVHAYLASVRRSGLAGFGEARRTVAQAWVYYTNFVESTQSDPGRRHV